MYSAGFIWKCLRALVATVFVASGILKLADIQAFRNSLESLSVASPFFLPALAVLLPLVELTLGVALILHPPPSKSGSVLCFRVVSLSWERLIAGRDEGLLWIFASLGNPVLLYCRETGGSYYYGETVSCPQK